MPLWSYLERGGKRAYPVWHRRSGKDDVALNWTAVSAMQKPATYWHMLPEAAQARKAIWDAINPHTGQRRIDQAFPASIRAATRENEMFIRFINGATWQVVGSDNFDSLVGSPPYGIVFSEWALSRPSAWSFLAPILRENGGWSLFITTPRGSNHAGRMFQGVKDDPEWFAERLTARQTGVFTEEQLQADRRDLIRVHGETVGNAIFEQEYLCSFESAVPGQVYAAEIAAAELEGRITRVPYDASKPVHTFWDLGFADSTSIWLVQTVGMQIRVLDFIQGSQQKIPYYLKQLSEKPYAYGTHWLPHDGANEGVGFDKTIEAQVRATRPGDNVQIVPKLDLVDGINALRTMFPGLWFDAERCAAGIECLKNYRYDVKDGQLSRNPVHDWSSHAADAARYMAVALKEGVKRKPLDLGVTPRKLNLGRDQSAGWMGL